MKSKRKPKSREEHELKMMQTPDDWPCWPVLPLKKWDEKSHTYDCAILFADGKPVVIKADLFLLNEEPGNTWGEKLKNKERIPFDSFDAIVVAGWRVD